MGKTILRAIFIFLVFFVFPFKGAHASLLVIREDGEVVINVLSETDTVELESPRHSYIEVKRIAETSPAQGSTVTLSRQNGAVNLEVSSDKEVRQLVVTDWKSDIVEIEERAEVQRLTIGVVDERFSLQQRGITAVTEFPVSVSAKNARLSLITESGERFVSIFPLQAVENALRTKFINRLTDSQIEIVEREREVQYRIAGEKVFNFFDIFEYALPVTTYISASTGEITWLDGPGWLKYINFLFS